MCCLSRVQYSCGCVKDSAFRQCEKRRATPIKCDKVSREVPERVDNYCLSHCMPDKGRDLTRADFEAVRDSDSGQVMFKILKDNPRG